MGITVSVGDSPYYISSGQVDTGDAVVSGGTMIVLSGGTASQTSISGGGTVIVEAGATDLGDQISGGTELNYGYASGDTMFAGSQVIESGGSAGAVLLSGGYEIISSGGTISAAGAAITVSGPTFLGGISNAGTISAATAIGVDEVALFSGSISNAGTISTAHSAIELNEVSTFSGGIMNTGMILTPNSGIVANFLGTFTGSIVNSGTISTGHAGIDLLDFTALSGGISNAGTMSGNVGIFADDFLNFSGGVSNGGTILGGAYSGIAILDGLDFSGGIINSGMISAADEGIDVLGSSTFAGGISNAGTIFAGDTALNAGGFASFAGGISNAGSLIGSVGIDIEAVPAASVFDGGTIVGSGGTAAELYGPTTNTFTLGSGQDISGVWVFSAFDFIIESGGVARAAVVGPGGTEMVNAGGSDYAAFLSGGTQLDYGSANVASVGSAGLQFVLSGGSASGSIVASAGELYIGAGGASLSAQIEGAGAEVVFGTDSGGSLSGTQYDFAIASGGTTFSGGYQLVAPGATASGMTVELGGQQYVGSGGTTLNALIEAGGAEVVFGTDSGASLSGTQYLYDSAVGGTTQSGGFQLVASGATASGMTVAYGGEQYVGSGGTTLDAQVVAGGAEVVFGVDSGASLSGTQYDYGTAVGGTTCDGAEQLVAPGAAASGMTVESGGQQYVGAGGTALATDIAAQGVEQVFGSDSGALISGTQYVFGVASGGSTVDGGYQLVGPAGAGTAIGMTVSSGGQQYVVGGGTASGTRVMGQGVEIVHGTDLGATISGTQYVYGVASGTVVGTGGYQLVSAGGTVSGAGISGGTIELTSGALYGAAPISFTGAGELILDASASFSGTVAGFGSASLSDSIDFADIFYVASGAGATAVTWMPSGGASGTLTVSEGGHTANVTLLGQYLGTFTPSSDGHGGTLVTYASANGATEPSPPMLINPQRG